MNSMAFLGAAALIRPKNASLMGGGAADRSDAE